MTSTQWVEYHVGTKRKSYNTLPTSNITAEAVTVGGFTLSQTDNAGVTTTAGRSYTANGMIHTHTNGRGNTSTTVTDAAGNVTTTAYDPAHDLPAMVTDAQGNTSCYRYDVRGRKVAEWGTGIQPFMFGYDDVDRMVTLTTFRAGTETVSTDPSDRTDGDITTWSYHNASGMEMAKTYADSTSVVKTYDAYNRVLTETDARGKVKAHTYEPARGLLLGTTYSDSTSPRTYTYNHLGQPTQVTDAAGVRTLSYNTYGEQEYDSPLPITSPTSSRKPAMLKAVPQATPTRRTARYSKPSPRVTAQTGESTAQASSTVARKSNSAMNTWQVHICWKSSPSPTT